MILSLSGFLFEDDYKSQSVSFAGFCRIARESGYDGVELRRTQVDPDTPGETIIDLKRILDDYGLTVTGLIARGLPDDPRRRDEGLRRYLDLCRNLGCTLLRVSGSPSWCLAACSLAEAFGVTLGANNHVGSPLETVAGTREFLAATAPGGFRLLYDALHLSISGEPYLDCIPEFAPVTRNILVHSCRPARPGEPRSFQAAGRAWVPVLPDESPVQDWPGVFQRFRSAGYDGLITVVESGWPVEQRPEIARRTAGAIRRMWEESRCTSR